MGRGVITFDVASYISQTLHLQVKVLSTDSLPKMPIYLQEAYNFQQIIVLHQTCLLMYPTTDELEPRVIKKHVEVLSELSNLPCILVSDHLTHYRRDQLMRAAIQFIMPGVQLYLPYLGLDLREKFRIKNRAEVNGLSPAAQSLFLQMLQSDRHFYRPAELSMMTNYSIMTISRSLVELKFLSLLHVEQEGRELAITIEDNRNDLWDRALPYLTTPVQSRIKAHHREINKLNYCLAGESALAKLTNLNYVDKKTVAVGKKEWAKHNIKHDADGEVIVEIWKFDPRFMQNMDTINPVFLYLSLKDHEDERIQIELDDLIADIKRRGFTNLHNYLWIDR